MIKGFFSIIIITFAKTKIDMRHLLAYIAILIMATLSATAQETVPQKTRRLPKVIKWIKDYMDSSTVKGIDRNYLEVPKKEWTAELTTTLNHATLKMETDWSYDEISGLLTARTNNGIATAVGIALAYRSYGIGYSKIVNGAGSNFSLSFSGSSYAINANIKSYSSDTPEVSFRGIVEGEEFIESSKEKINDPINVRTVFIDGYYLFNGKRFSYLAAYSPSLIQRRSSGSVMAGAMYYHARANYESNENIDMLLAMQGVGKMKLSQVCIGAGYAYNWVPARGWLVSAMAMPMLALYNKTKTYHYKFRYIGDPDIMPDVYDPDQWELASDEVEVNETPNRVKFNYDARIAIVHHWDNWFIRAYGHYNSFLFGQDNTSGRFTDWTIYASVGTRF